MRIGVGGLMHETNTFAAEETGLADFKSYHFAAGEELYAYRGTRTELGGFLDGCAELGFEVVPSLYALAMPAGPVRSEVFDAMLEEMATRLRGAGTPDGVLLALHGAMVTSASSDADGDALRLLAGELGAGVPLVSTVDFHANTTDAMTSHVDALVGYDTYPHVDMYERGREAVRLLVEVMRHGERRRVAHEKVGLITPPQAQYTGAEPMRSIMERVHQLEGDEDVTITVTPGFPYADIDCLGLSVVVSSSDAARSAQVAKSLAVEIEGFGDEFRVDSVPVAEAVERALRANGPVALVDSADNVGGGCPGDGTAVLEEWLRRGGSGLVVVLSDPQAVRRCIEAGVGSSLRLEVGAKTDGRHGSPVELSGTVRLISDGRYVNRGSFATGIPTEMGHSAVLESSGNTVVLTENRVLPFDAQQLLSLGVSPRYCRAFVVKSAVAWRAAFGEYAAEVIDVDAPGICTANLRRLDLAAERYKRVRPLLPGMSAAQAS